MSWQAGCVDTTHGRVHRFLEGADRPCQCGAVLQNVPRTAVGATAQPYGTRMLPVLNALQRGDHTVDQLVELTHKPKTWVKHAITILARAGKVTKKSTTTRKDARGHRRTVAIYGLPTHAPYSQEHADHTSG